MIRIKRAYEPAEPMDGERYLVERLWPRGIRKDELEIAGWVRDVAPSSELRRWFGHDPEKWAEFRRRYFEELDQNHSAWGPLLELATRHDLTLIYSARDTEHNNAVALKDYLNERLRWLQRAA